MTGGTYDLQHLVVALGILDHCTLHKHQFDLKFFFVICGAMEAKEKLKETSEFKKKLFTKITMIASNKNKQYINNCHEINQ